MSTIFPGSYQIKKALLWPRTVFKRWRHRNSSAEAKALLERYYYRTAAFDFLAATERNRHLLHDAQIDSNSVVVDVGAAAGDWAQQIVDRYDPVIYAFEPNPAAFARLSEKAVHNPKLQPKPYGLGEKDGTEEVVLGDPGSPVIATRNQIANTSCNTNKIAAVDRVWHDLRLGQVDLMRIGINGGEFRLLDRMIQTGLLNKVNCFMIQFHERHPGAYGKRLRIREELSKTHRLEWEYYFIWEKWVRF